LGWLEAGAPVQVREAAAARMTRQRGGMGHPVG